MSTSIQLYASQVNAAKWKHTAPIKIYVFGASRNQRVSLSGKSPHHTFTAIGRHMPIILGSSLTYFVISGMLVSFYVPPKLFLLSTFEAQMLSLHTTR